MSAPDFEGVLAAHRLHQSMNICTCRDWRAMSNAGSLRDQHEAHLSAALHAEVARWLADEGTREAVAEVLNRRTGSHMGSGSWMPLAREITNVLAGRDPLEHLRAALTTTTQEDR